MVFHRRYPPDGHAGDYQPVSIKKNAAIINPVTGKAYRTDYPSSQAELIALREDRSYDVPSNVRDPRYQDPRDNNVPSYLNPANFLEQRHIMLGIGINF